MYLIAVEREMNDRQKKKRFKKRWQEFVKTITLDEIFARYHPMQRLSNEEGE